MNYNKIIIALVIVLVAIAVVGIVVFNPFAPKTDSKIAITSANQLKDGDSFSIVLTDVNGNPLANQVVNITIIDADGNQNHQQITTDGSGNGVLQLNGLTPGEFTFDVNYAGNDDYNACNVNVKLTIEKQETSSVSNGESSSQPSDWVDSDGDHHFYENGKEYVGSREGQHMDIDTHNYVKEHGMAD